jgi:DNA topoisomerase-3
MRVDEAVALAQSEIATVFARSAPPPDIILNEDTGKLGEILGPCPKCGRNVIRGKNAYGCIGYTEGCDFRIGLSICHRDVSKHEVMRLLATRSTATIRGFLSKRTGKRFDGKLVLNEKNEVVFSFR